MNESSPAREPLPVSGAVDADRQPPLGISHVMGWMLGTAVILAAGRAVDSRELGQIAAHAGAIKIEGNFGLVLYAFLAGAALGGLLLWISRLIRGGPRFPDSPGHWLLWLSGWSTAVTWVSVAAFPLREGADWNTFLFRLVLKYMLMSGLVGVVLVLWKRPRTWWWLLAWLTILVSQLWSAGWGLDFAWGWFRGFLRWNPLLWFGTARVAAGCVCLAVVLDWRRGARQDWLYWVGVAIWIGTYLFVDLPRWLWWIQMRLGMQ